MNSFLLRFMQMWLPCAIAIIGISCVIYIVIQQDLRISGNDPQIQMAEDTASAINNGNMPPLAQRIEVAESLAPFTIIYDLQGNVISSSAFLHGKTPSLPAGVLTATKGTLGESRITWQPQSGVRLASVIVLENAGYVLVGRNMREIEMRENDQLRNVFVGGVITLAGTFFCVLVTLIALQNRKIKRDE